MNTDIERCGAELDELALLSHQPYNVGNEHNWFFTFRISYFGMLSRLVGLQEHTRLLHSWPAINDLAAYKSRRLHEHHVTIMLFCMDSSIECFVFALNALGQAHDKANFRDVSNREELQRITPMDVIRKAKSKVPLGYIKYFPSLRDYWNQQHDFIKIIMDNHDTSKHRHQFVISAMMQYTPPPEYLALTGLPAHDRLFLEAAPMLEVSVHADPKAPHGGEPNNRSDSTTLEKLEPEFWEFMGKSICLAVSDARANFHLKDNRPQ